MLRRFKDVNDLITTTSSRNLGGLLATITLMETRIQKKYDALGGAAFFGELEQKKSNVWYFKSGSCICYNSRMSEAFEIHGAIYRKWVDLGGIRWSIPITDETSTSDSTGRFNHFENEGSIYWTPTTGAQAIYGDIRRRWASLGWERSYLGYPTSDEVDFPEGGRVNTFQNGGIYWWPDVGSIDLRDVIVHYTGLHCFGETDWDQSSNSDEPYVILSISTPERAATFTSRIYEDADAGETRPDLMEIYRGKPYGINLNAVLMEHDFGDPNVYRKDVEDIVTNAHKVGTMALGAIPIVGPAIAAIAGPLLGSLMPAIAGAINNLFDFGDDRIGGATVTLSAKQMVILAARTNNSNFNGIGFKVESPLIVGSGASYKVFFGVVPV
jgi:LGFP repeat